MEDKKTLHEKIQKIYEDILILLEKGEIEYQKLEKLIDIYLDFDGVSFFAQHVVENPVSQTMKWNAHLPQDISLVFYNCFETVAKSDDLNTVRYAYEAVHEPKMKDFEKQSELLAYTKAEIKMLEDILKLRLGDLNIIKGEDILRKNGWDAVYKEEELASENVISAFELDRKEWEMGYNLRKRSVEAFNQNPDIKKPITTYALFYYLEEQLMRSHHHKEAWLIYPEDQAWIEQQNPRDCTETFGTLMKKYKEGDYGPNPYRTHVPGSKNSSDEDMYHLICILRLKRAYGDQTDQANKFN